MEEHGPPTRIDRSFLPGMSGAGQTQLIAGLKSLGLIDEDGTVQPRLVEMVTQPDRRAQVVGEMIRERYPEAVELGKRNATTGELVEVFREHYGVQGDTARKAIAFYLQAAAYAGDVPLSPNFKTPSTRSNGGVRRRPRPGQTEQVEREAPATSPPPLPGMHPAIQTLVQSLPKFEDGAVKPEFSTAEREAWFAYAKATFNLIYARPEGDSGDSS